MSGRFQIKAALVALSCGLLPARTGNAAGDARATTVWYRADASCPDGEAFIQQVTRRTKQARLAGVGDHIDFVVTLGMKQRTGFGRLEKQTARGTIAIREISGQSCAEIAEALALTLALTVAPEPHDADAPVPPVTETEIETETETPEPAPPSTRPEPAPAAPPPSAATQPNPPASESRSESIFGGVASLIWARGIAPHNMWGVGAFGFWTRASEQLIRPSLRAGVQVGWADANGLRMQLTAGRIEASVIDLGRGRFALRPCLDAALGRVSVQSTSGGNREGDLWFAAGALIRAEYRAAPFQFEIHGGGQVPLTRYSVLIAGDSRELFRTKAVVGEIGIGVGLVFM